MKRIGDRHEIHLAVERVSEDDDLADHSTPPKSASGVLPKQDILTNGMIGGKKEIL